MHATQAAHDREFGEDGPRESELEAKVLELEEANAVLLDALRVLTDRVDPGMKGRDLGIRSLVDALKRARTALAKAGGSR